MFDFFRKKSSATVQPTDRAANSNIEQANRGHLGKTLSELVERNSTSPLGAFEDINLDLGRFIDKFTLQGDPLVLMAYAYARRSAAAGLYFQGCLQHSAIVYLQDIFQNFQRTTGQTVAFQEAASAQGTAFIQQYLPRLTSIHEKTMLMHARDGLRVPDVAEIEDIPFDFDMHAEPTLGPTRCIDLLDQVMEKRMLGQASTSASPRQLRLIDIVEKTSQSKLGAFANIVEDAKASGGNFQGDTLFAAAGMACILGACGAYVAGGVHPNLVLDVLKMASNLGVSDPSRFDGEPSTQALMLAKTYVPGINRDIAVEILRVGLALDTFLADGESGRLSAEEVVRRARKQLV